MSGIWDVFVGWLHACASNGRLASLFIFTFSLSAFGVMLGSCVCYLLNGIHVVWELLPPTPLLGVVGGFESIARGPC